jgi:hypothetical protein
MVVGFTITYAISSYHHWCCGFKSRSGRGVQNYVIKFVGDLRQVGGCLRVLLFHHRDLRPVYCPTDTYKITTEEPQDGDVVNWNGTKEILTQQVYALRYTTVESKKYNLEVDGGVFQTKHMQGLKFILIHWNNSPQIDISSHLNVILIHWNNSPQIDISSHLNVICLSVDCCFSESG